jgi:plasmid maintenance system antidote protein VapI
VNYLAELLLLKKAEVNYGEKSPGSVLHSALLEVLPIHVDRVARAVLGSVERNEVRRLLTRKGTVEWVGFG